MFSKNKNLLIGMSIGFIIGSSITALIYYFNIPVIEKIKYIPIIGHDFNEESSDTLNISKPIIKKSPKQIIAKLIPDSIVDSVNSTIISENNDIDTSNIIMKDELIGIKYVSIKNNQNENLNNLIEEKKSSKILIEFWKSPINYKGYKVFPEKIIIYGIDEISLTEIYTSENIFYLKYKDNVYKLQDNDTYMPLTKTLDKNIINNQKYEN